MVRSIAHVFFHAADRYPDRPAFEEQSGQIWTYAELSESVRELALGFSTLGIRHGDRVGLFADNSIHWILSDLAILSLGAADVPRGTDTSPSEVDYLIRHSGARVVVIQNRRLLDELAPVLADISDLQCIVLHEGTFRDGDPRPVLSLEEVRERGRQRLAEGATLHPYLDATRGSDTATIVYTSGTTGKPKGVVLRHENILHNIRAVPAIIEFDSDDVFLSILPAWHMFERLIEYAAIAKGCKTVYTSRRTFKSDLAKHRPTVLAAVPRVYEMLYDETRRKLNDQPVARRAIAGGLLKASLLYRQSQNLDPMTGKPRSRWPRLFSPARRLADKMLFTKFRGALGGRLRVLVSGGGSLPLHVDEFFDAAGVPLLNGYGLTETAPLISVRRFERPTLRAVGPPIPGTWAEVRRVDGTRCDPGEVGVLFVKGPQVMEGYYKDRKSTTAAFDDEGFFNTGDLAREYPSGDLEITGRAKDTIVLAGGENVEPEPIENALRLSPYIDQVVVVGQDKKQLGALVVVDREAVKSRIGALVTAGGGEDDASFDPTDERLISLLRGETARLTSRDQGFRPYEQVRRFTVVPRPFSIEEGELTETLKLKRHAINEHFQAEIAAMFA